MNDQRKNIGNGFWVGASILLFGSLLLLDRMEMLDFPRWLFSWKVLLIAMGLVIGINKRFEGIGWLILILVGSFFLLDDIPGFPYDFDEYAFPIGIMIVGLFMVSRAIWGSGSREARKTIWGKAQADGGQASGEDYFNLTTIFGANKRKIFSKKFRGGEATCIFGGADIDLSQADIEGTVVMDLVQLFGGIKLIIPSNWELKSDMTVILGGIDDKRNMHPQPVPSDKKLVLTGVVMFGGIDIKSY